MNSLVYFYSKFTEEFLLLGAAISFGLLSVYFYHWVIQKRRLGVARSQIPSTVVKGYLNQLIGEAEFVRAQLFGLSEGQQPGTPPAQFFNAGASASPIAEGGQPISADLSERMNALEAQLKEKETLVVNINIEKVKLLEEIERLKQNQGGAAGPGGAPAAQDDLSKKIKNLEARLEEYSLFEEDLANLKRLQQENTQLKKKVVDMGVNPDTVINIPAAPKDEASEKQSLNSDKPEQKVAGDLNSDKPEQKIAGDLNPNKEATAAPKTGLDPNAVDALLNGTPATPPTTPTATPPPAPAQEAAKKDAAPTPPTPISPAAAAANVATEAAAKAEAEKAEKLKAEETAKAEKAKAEAAAKAAAPAAATAAPAAKPEEAKAAAAAPDSFDKLADSVENSLSPPKVDPSLATKTDEELLKEFENLLNS